MLRLCGVLLRRISYITDVEGDFSYFQRYVCLSRVLKWEDVSATTPQETLSSHKSSSSTAASWAPLQSPLVSLHSTRATVAAATGAKEPVAASPALPHPSPAPAPDSSGVALTINTQGSADTAEHHHRHPATDGNNNDSDDGYMHLIDAARYRLTFRDSTSHFVFGGDAFDHGADLTFGRVLLDFKRRFPARVHLLLGNRDVNKMVFYPRMALEVGGMTADAAEQHCFALPSLPRDAAVAASMKEQLRYKDYLRLRRNQAAATTAATTSKSPATSASAEHTEEELIADPVTFLQWTLKHKLGCPNAFDHRRHELQLLAELNSTRDASSHESPGPRGAMTAAVSDQEVADSFFRAAQPGGVYHDYIFLGELTVLLDGVLFLHGGVNGSNAGFVPSLEATTYSEQLKAGQWWLPEVQPVPPAAKGGEKGKAAAATAATSLEQASSPVSFSSSTASAAAPRRKSALEWLAALSAFKAAAVEEWVSGRGWRGEALRGYVYPRVAAPHSVAVGTVMQADGPHHICLPAAAYLIESGIHTVCGGHQPVGDTPAVVRQPGGFVILDADTSYCGRGNAFCTRYNRRGAAVMELIIDSGHEKLSEEKLEEADSGEGTATVATVEHAVAPSLLAHGFRADGTPFEFDLLDDLRVGRYVGNGWWVRLPPCAVPTAHAGHYELRRTRDGFRHEEARWAMAAEVDALLQETAASGQALVEGELAPRYTKAELAEVRVHRVKTKVKRTSETESGKEAEEEVRYRTHTYTQ